MQYLEFISSLNPDMAYFEKSRLFMSTRDYKTFSKYIDTTDNEQNQCFYYHKACWQNLMTIKRQDPIYFAKE